VDDALAVGVVEGIGGAAEDGDETLVGQPPAAQQARQGAAGDEPHGHPRDAALDAEGVDGDDVRVFEPRHDLRFATEPLARTLVVEELARQDLQGDVAVEGGLVGPVDRGHAAPPERLDDAISAERRTGSE
jgi:hypothetical protein